jgi:hypothetical protein
VDCKSCADASWKRSGRLHWMSHREATENMARSQTGNPEKFGKALHAIQDYYSHFGKGYEGLTTDGAGTDLYDSLFALDDIDPSAHGGLDIETRRKHAEEKGHAGSTVGGRNPDRLINDAWDQLMMKETKAWIWSFTAMYFLTKYGSPPDDPAIAY